MLLRPWNSKGLCTIVCFGRLKGVCLFLIFLLESWAGLAVLPCPCQENVLLFGEGAEVLPGGLHSCPTAALLVCQQKAALGWVFSFFWYTWSNNTDIYPTFKSNWEQIPDGLDLGLPLFGAFEVAECVPLGTGVLSTLIPGWCVLLQKPQCWFCHFRALLLPCAGCFLCQRMEGDCFPLPVCTGVSGWLRTFILLQLDIPIWALLFSVGLKSQKHLQVTQITPSFIILNIFCVCDHGKNGK